MSYIPIMQRRSVRRWTVNRKAEILAEPPSVQDRLLARFNISPEELAEWRAAINAHGREGLRVTYFQCYR